MLPIVGKSYFPRTVTRFVTEVDNTAPSATYKSKVLNKVDVVFAVGETEQSQQLKEYIPTFTNQLKSSENYVDAYVEQVETSTIDMSAFGAREIFETWRKMPITNNPWALDERRGAVYTKGARAYGRTQQSIIDPEGYKTTDFTTQYTFDVTPPSSGGHAGELGGAAVRVGDDRGIWSGHTSGFMFRIQDSKEVPGAFNCYILNVAYQGIWHGPNKVIYWVSRVENVPYSHQQGRVTRLDHGVRLGYDGFNVTTMHVELNNTNGVVTIGSPHPYYFGFNGRLKPQDITTGINTLYMGSDGQGTDTGGQAYSYGYKYLGGAMLEPNEKYKNVKIDVVGNNFKVYSGNRSDELILDVVDDDIGKTYTSNRWLKGTGNYAKGQGYLEEGTYGFTSASSPDVYFMKFAITKEKRKTLGDAISDVSWRDGATRFIIHTSDVIPEDMDKNNTDLYTGTASKLMNSNAYLINLGNGINRAAMVDIINKISTPDGEVKGTFINNNRPNINSAMTQAKDWIVSKIRGLSKPTDWILVDELVQWQTSYKDNEKDLPLNFGKNKDDRELARTWGVAWTDLYKSEGLLAEKWRYRHDNNFYDNSGVTATYSDIWVPDPVESFSYPGKYRINYKRKDNPLYNDSSINNVFDNYRYFSKDYDIYKGNSN